jgi:hypothetical protein
MGKPSLQSRCKRATGRHQMNDTNHPRDRLLRESINEYRRMAEGAKNDAAHCRNPCHEEYYIALAKSLNDLADSLQGRPLASREQKGGQHVDVISLGSNPPVSSSSNSRGESNPPVSSSSNSRGEDEQRAQRIHHGEGEGSERSSPSGQNYNRQRARYPSLET